MTTEGEQQQYEETNILRKYIYFFLIYLNTPFLFKCGEFWRNSQSIASQSQPLANSIDIAFPLKTVHVGTH